MGSAYLAETWPWLQHHLNISLLAFQKLSGNLTRTCFPGSLLTSCFCSHPEIGSRKQTKTFIWTFQAFRIILFFSLKKEQYQWQLVFYFNPYCLPAPTVSFNRFGRPGPFGYVNGSASSTQQDALPSLCCIVLDGDEFCNRWWHIVRAPCGRVTRTGQCRRRLAVSPPNSSSSTVVVSAPLEGSEEGDNEEYWCPKSNSKRQVALPGANDFLIRNFM